MLTPSENWTRYIVDHRYYGIAALVEAYLDYFRNNIYNKFNAIFYGSYNKFLAALQGKIENLNINPTEVKYIATTVTEGQLLPALNVDVASIEQDDIAGTLYFNFQNISSSLEKIVGYNDSLIINSSYILVPQYTYIKLNLDFIAAFESWYQKADFEFSLIQGHWGINRTKTFNMEALVPLNGYLERDLSLSQPVNIRPIRPNPPHKRKLRDVVYRVIYPVGREAYHFIYYSTPKITLSGVNDSSEKYGGDRLPQYKTTFSVTIEDYILNSYLVSRIGPFDGVLFGVFPFEPTPNPEDRNLLNLLFIYLEQLLSLHGITLTLEIFVQLLMELMNILNIGEYRDLIQFIVSVLCSNDLNSIHTFLNNLSTAINNIYGINFPISLMYNLLINSIMGENSCPIFSSQGLDFPIYSAFSSTVGLQFFPISNTCYGIPSELARIIVYRVPNNIPFNSELRIPPSIWKLTPTTIFVGVPNAYTLVSIDPNTEEIVIKGPLIEGYNLLIVVRIS